MGVDLTLSVKFWIWIVAGALLLIIADSIVWNNVCIYLERGTSEQQQSREDNDGAIDLRHLISGAVWRAIAFTKTNQENAKADIQKTKKTDQPPRWGNIICDAKITDMGLVYFTYCLVIVGWFGIRSNQITIQELERAFIAVGPINIRVASYMDKERSTPGKQILIERTTLTLFVHNTGRTTANLKKVYGEFSKDAPKGDVPIYVHGASRDLDLSIAASQESRLHPVEFADDYDKDQFFWGCVEYTDIFKRKHTARFCAHIFPGRFDNPGRYDIAGSEGWRECD